MTIKEAKQFWKMWDNWLGVGLAPVVQSEAERRANICRVCPMNQPKGLEEQIKKMAVNMMWTAIVATKTQMNLRVSHEKELHLCQACKCVLAMKVWVPEKTIRETTEATDFHENCWIPPILK